MALKVKFPTRIFMIRGNHEDININRAYGFENECAKKLDEFTGDQSSAFMAINEAFDYLPLAALIETPKDRIFCCHGGISRNDNSTIE